MPGLEAIPLPPFPAIADPSPPLRPHPQDPGGSRHLILCVCVRARARLTRALLPAGGHGPSGAGSAGSLLRGRLRLAACTCLSSAPGIEMTECSLVHYVGLQPLHSFRSLLIPFSQAHPSILPPFPVLPPVDQGTSQTSLPLTFDVGFNPPRSSLLIHLEPLERCYLGRRVAGKEPEEEVLCSACSELLAKEVRKISPG